MDLFDSIFSLIAPNSCVVCYNKGSLLHSGCVLEDLSPRCLICLSLADDWRPCPNCADGRLSHLQAAVEYNDISKQLVLGLKAERKREAAKIMAQQISDRMSAEVKQLLCTQNYIVVASPTTPGRIRQRGLDHGDLIAKRLATNLRIKYQKNMFSRTGSAKQAGSSRRLRLTQLSSLDLHGSVIRDGKYLLVDDVITTGSTIARCSDLLFKAGASDVKACLFAASL